MPVHAGSPTTLSRKELLQVIETMEARSIDDEEERRAVSSRLSMWCGRPGFFFDCFLPRFREQFRGTAHGEAEAKLIENTFDEALNKLLDPASVAVTAARSSTSSTTATASMAVISSDMARLVEAGLAIGKSVGVVAEPLVRSFLDSVAHKLDAYAGCDKYIASEDQAGQGLLPVTIQSQGTAAKLSAALQFDGAIRSTTDNDDEDEDEDEDDDGDDDDDNDEQGEEAKGTFHKHHKLTG
ncbi:uncharacterized protein ACA1_006160 [Acanthamoeba castellanii str. Neff]|uniref:Uncharacterized protein n=1 Tax=Acanthamoeba castellanii (strain ATCC 30010 / Neff) TaxID=1257118 RepID=L8HGY4_ACACF|nr:uncharacterized protein ACA1_006160 [Acanthamoeba castellanii str. Neff]ELR24482.1 hypothetical protein ACA1_006160 [Acanthamoeba castellanii str. Neff]